MNIKLLLKAMRYMLVPTISIIGFLMFSFFSFTKPFVFLAGDTSGSVASRIAILVLEIILVLYMYNKYQEEEKIKQIEQSVLNNDKLKDLNFRQESARKELKELFNRFDSDSEITEVADTHTPNIKLVRLRSKKS